MRYAVAVLAGTLVSGLAAGLLGSLGPSAGFPPLSRNLLSNYRALAGAPFGSAMELFVMTAVIFFACFLVTGLLERRKARAMRTLAPAEVPEPDRQEEPVPW